MESVQTMRWILVSMTAVSAVIAASLGYYVAAVVLLLGVAVHTAHWYTTRSAAASEAPTED
ncbi:hypothetical protein BH23ACT9_BH23ACT9_09150 [soil metagenome]